MSTSDLYEPKLGFLSGKIIHHIELHSDELADGLLLRVENCARLRPLREKVSAEEVRQHAYDVYRHLGEWLQTRSEGDVEHRYVEFGERRARQGVPLSQLVLAMFATKEHLWEHMTDEVFMDHAHDIFQVLELSRSLEKFFDRAVHFTTVGYERHRPEAHHATAKG
jgi:hypothetical protein